jgi:predicted PhzF superfamily epimerase YddE/YHI9
MSRFIESGTQIILSQGADVGRPSTLYALAHGTHDKITSIKVGGGVCLIGSGELWLPASDIVSALVVESST